MAHAEATLAGHGETGRLILDRLGRILSCGSPAERIFGANQVRLIGKRISEFIAGFGLSEHSPSFNQRYLVYLCADNAWRKFEATDSDGHRIAVELNLARVNTGGEEMFLLSVRLDDAKNSCFQASA
ncbi:MAG: PAS domain S-box protein [Sulfuritalea sp.]|nr:PAS domain S-box protein [Sulfuritalea sp.]